MKSSIDDHCEKASDPPVRNSGAPNGQEGGALSDVRIGAARSPITVLGNLEVRCRCARRASARSSSVSQVAAMLSRTRRGHIGCIICFCRFPAPVSSPPVSHRRVAFTHHFHRRRLMILPADQLTNVARRCGASCLPRPRAAVKVQQAPSVWAKAPGQLVTCRRFKTPPPAAISTSVRPPRMASALLVFASEPTFPVRAARAAV